MEQSLIPCQLFPGKCAGHEQCPQLHGASQSKHSIPQWHPTQTSHFGFLEKYHIPGVQGTAPPVQSQALRARRDGWCQGWGLDSHHLILLEHRDSSFLLIQTGILVAFGFSSLADTNCPCPHFGMDSTLWSHNRPRPGDNTTAQLSLLGCLSLCAFPAPLEP